MTIIAPAVKRQLPIVYLNDLMTVGISKKKSKNSTSLDIAPQDISMPNICQRIACKICRDRPPKKRTNIKHHLKFSRTIIEYEIEPNIKIDRNNLREERKFFFLTGTMVFNRKSKVVSNREN
jgi:hypothetical protein